MGPAAASASFAFRGELPSPSARGPHGAGTGRRRVLATTPASRIVQQSTLKWRSAWGHTARRPAPSTQRRTRESAREADLAQCGPRLGLGGRSNQPWRSYPRWQLSYHETQVGSPREHAAGALMASCLASGALDSVIKSAPHRSAQLGSHSSELTRLSLFLELLRSGSALLVNCRVNSVCR